MNNAAYTVYILLTDRNTLYTGQTDDLKRRLIEHRSKNGKGAKYLRMFADFKIVYTEMLQTRNDALKREAAIKKMDRKHKDLLIQGIIKP